MCYISSQWSVDKASLSVAGRKKKKKIKFGEVPLAIIWICTKTDKEAEKIRRLKKSWSTAFITATIFWMYQSLQLWLNFSWALHYFIALIQNVTIIHLTLNCVFGPFAFFSLFWQQAVCDVTKALFSFLPLNSQWRHPQQVFGGFCPPTCWRVINSSV